MRRSPFLTPFVAGIVVMWLVVMWTQSSSSASDAVKGAFERFAEDGHAKLLAYSTVVEHRLEDSLTRMFDDLDKNHDGCIDRSEFHGKTLNVLATVRSLEVPHMPLPQLPTIGYSIVSRVIGLQFLFLVALFILEHIRVIFFDPPFGMKTDAVDWNPSPRRATISKAMHYDTPSTHYETLKFVFFLVTGLLILRIVLAILFFTVGILFVNLSVLGGRTRQGNPTWFAACSAFVKLFGYLGLASMGFYCIRVHGHRASQSDTKLLLGNHICIVEVIVLYLLAEMPSFVSRVENLSIPLFRGVSRASDAVIVDRDASASRTKTLEAIKRRANDEHATQLLVFPEGTCNNQLSLFQYKKGAFEPGVPVQLVCFHFPYKHFNPAWTGRASGGNDAWDLMLRLMSQFVNRLEVRFLPVYTPTEEEKCDPLRFASHCQAIVADVLRCEISDATFGDYVEAYKRYNKQCVVNADSNVVTPRSSQPRDSDGEEKKTK